MGMYILLGTRSGLAKMKKMSGKVLAHLLRVFPRLVHWSTRVSASSLPVWMVNWVHDMPPSLSQAGCNHSSVAHWESTWQHPHHSRTCGPQRSNALPSAPRCRLPNLCPDGNWRYPSWTPWFGHPNGSHCFQHLSSNNLTMLIIVPSGNLRKTNTLR